MPGQRSPLPARTPQLPLSADCTATLAGLKEQPVQPPSSAPTANFEPSAQLYKDLCVFEDRLRSNLRILRRRQRKYQAVALTLLIVFILLLYWGYQSLETNGYVPFSAKCLVFGSGLTLTLFLNTKRYRVAVDNAAHYVPRCNKTLYTYNMSFNHKDSHKLLFSSLVPEFISENLSRYRELYFKRKAAALLRRKEKMKT